MKTYKKAVTFSYDDGVTQDIRLVEMFNRYGLKATFNLNSEFFGMKGELVREDVRVDHIKVNREDVKSIYDGHEVAVHTLTHPTLPGVEQDEEIIRQVEQDRVNLSELVGYEVLGMAYPGGGKNFDDRCADLIRANTGVQYARTTVSTFEFKPTQGDLLQFHPTCHHLRDEPNLTAVGEAFLNCESDDFQLLYVWGHSYEFDIRDEWTRFEEFCKMISGHDDILYATNLEAFRYAKVL
ncbi:MAG TPA: polysaccharide deacetylase [Ruminococcaceae bacterium]|nr:polysaccharide deacetylase [Oscillospiraceae bacterium]